MRVLGKEYRRDWDFDTIESLSAGPKLDKSEDFTLIEDAVLTVSGLNQYARTLLETAFPWVQVRGEISNFSAPRSGHWYFTLKDAHAQIRCAMFRPHNQRLAIMPKDGDQMQVGGKISLYADRGDYQLIATEMQPGGEGALRQAFEALKKRLAAEGLFEPERKKSIPKFPTCIGIITSPTGAALQDILTTLKRRYPIANVIVISTQVQGDKAKAAIVTAITQAQKTLCDVLILARGGGSLEDLWPFNEECVARAIARSTIPIISGVGHETDTTIADYVADLRAPTPTAAAEHAAPDIREWENFFESVILRLHRAMQSKIDRCSMRLDGLTRKILDPKQRIALLQVQCTNQHQRIDRAMQYILEAKKNALTHSIGTLEACSPLSTLARGYSIVTMDDGSVVRGTNTLLPGDTIYAQLAEGKLRATMIDVVR